MNSVIQKDLYRYIGKDSAKLLWQLRYFFFTIGFRYTYFYRRAQFASSFITRVFWTFFLRQCMLRSGIQIPFRTKIGEGFRIVHFGHIVINPDTIIGKNFNICQGCLIGNSQGKKSGVPTIGDNVCINANAVIVGGVHIGNNVLIAPNAFVNFDVPDNCVVIGNPGQIITKDSSPTAKYIAYPYCE